MKKSRRPFSAGCIAMGVGCLALACAAPDTPPQTPLELGETLFTQETFDGNGRVCSTCHELEHFGTITPELVQQRWAEDPEGPLFRAIDSDDGAGTSYDRLRRDATMRIPIELPLHDSGLSVRPCDDPAATEVILHRGNPSVFNVALEQHLMVDGREGDDLAAQALSAVETHNEHQREPTPEELELIATFQESLFSHEALRAAAASGTMPRLPEGGTPSEVRGRAFFQPRQVCGECHFGPLLNRAGPTHVFAPGVHIETSQVGREPANPNPKREWCWVDPATNEIAETPAGTRVYAEPVSDPGIALVAGTTCFTDAEGVDRCLSNDIVASEVGGPAFKIPTLWGIADTAPYFHDNSAKTLEEVLDQYEFMFREMDRDNFSFECPPAPEPCLTEQDRADILAFLELLSFEELEQQLAGKVASSAAGHPRAGG